jgi:hypothetical protein
MRVARDTIGHHDSRRDPMIDFNLNDEQRLLEQSVREWGAREVAPLIGEHDRRHHFDREPILGGMAKLGLVTSHE